MEKVFKDGEIHNVSGFTIECKPTLLRDELKQIHLDKLKKETTKNEENKKKKKKKKKKKNDKKGREFKNKEKTEQKKRPPGNGLYVVKKSKKLEEKNQKEEDIESCWFAESSGFQSNIKLPANKKSQPSSNIKKGPKTWAQNSEENLSNKVSINDKILQQSPQKKAPEEPNRNSRNEKRESMGSATRPSETLISDELTQKDVVNRSNPFANTKSHKSSLNFSTDNQFPSDNIQPPINQQIVLNNNANSFYPPNYDNQHQNTHLFDYYPQDSLSQIFTPSSFLQPQSQVQNPNCEEEQNDEKNIDDQIDHRNRRRGNATLWKSDLIDSVNKYTANMKEVIPATSAEGNHPRANTGFSKQDPAHPGFNMYRMLPYETKSEALGRASQFSAMTYEDRSSSDMVNRNYGLTGFNGLNNTNYIPQQAHYSSTRTTDPSLAGNRPSGLGRPGQNAEMNRKTTSDFYRDNKTPNMHYSQQLVNIKLIFRAG